MSNTNIRNGKYAVNYCSGHTYGFFRYSLNNPDTREVYCVINAGPEADEINLPVLQSGTYSEYLGEGIAVAEKTEQKDEFCIYQNGYRGIIKILLQPYEAKVFVVTG